MMRIVENGQALYSIVYPKNASECNKFAAEELQNFIEKCTGVKLPLQTDETPFNGGGISVGNTCQYQALNYLFDFQSLNGDGFFIKGIEGNIYINADYERGLLFGVYDFLERYLGVRFIARDTTILPKTDCLEIQEPDIVSVPDFRMRGYLESAMFEHETFKIMVDYDFALRKRAHHTFLSPDKKHGGRPTVYGRNNCHNFHYYVPMDVYNDPNKPETYHPEFYYGKGVGRMDVTEDAFFAKLEPTICLTNGLTDDGEIDESMDISVVKVVIEEMKKDVLANPDITYFVLDQEDGPIYCKCKKCMEAESKYLRSGILIRFCNAVAKALQKWADEELGGRKIYIVTFAYSYAAQPPIKEVDGQLEALDETVKPCDNLVMRMCVCSTKMFSCFDERQTASTKKMLAGWKMLAKKFFVWTYDAFFDRYLLFFPSFERIESTVRGFKEYGAEYLMINGAYNSKGLWQDIMKAYIWQALLWDSTQKMEDLAKEFLLHYFGEIGAEYVKKFMRMYYAFYEEECAKRDVFFHNFGMKAKDAFPKELLVSTLELIKEAREAVRDGEKDLEKVKLYDKHLAQVQLNSTFPLTEHFKHYFPEKSEEDYLAFAKEFVALCEYADVQKYHEQIWVDSFVKDNYKFPY